MHALFHDVENHINCSAPYFARPIMHTAQNADFNHVLYADDTIIFSHSAKALEKLLGEIEKEGGKYGMKLNKRSAKRYASEDTIRSILQTDS